MCGEEKVLGEFYPNSRRDGDYLAYCKPCHSERKRARRLAVPAVLELERAQVRNWRHAHRDWAAKLGRQQYAKNLEHSRALGRAAVRRNKANRLEQYHRRRARLKANFVAPVNMDEIWERDGGICQICKQPVARTEASPDHIVPISRGGAHAPWNVQLTHRWCNVRRNAGRIPAQMRLPI